MASSCPFPLKVPLVCCFFPKVGGTRLFITPVDLHFPPLQAFATERSCLFRMSVLIENNDEIVRRAKWYLIICLETLTLLKGFLSENSLWTALRVLSSRTCCRGGSCRHCFLAGPRQCWPGGPSPPTSCFEGHSAPGRRCSDSGAGEQ